MRALVLVVCSLAVASCGGGSSGSSSSAASQATTTADPITKAATELASVQEGSQSSSGDPLVQQFATALSDLESVCSENPGKLAGFIYAAQQDLQKNNRSASLLHIAQALDTAATPLRPNGPTDCAPILAVYLVDAEKPGGVP